MVGSGKIRKRTLNLYLPLTAYVIFLLFPFYWMIIVSLKPTPDLFELKYIRWAVFCAHNGFHKYSFKVIATFPFLCPLSTYL